jgi:hypothetical protein
MLYRQADGTVTEVDTAGATDGQILTRVAGVPAWADGSSLANLVFQDYDANDAIFEAVNGSTNLAQIVARNQRSVLGFSDGGGDPDFADESIVFAGVMPTYFNPPEDLDVVIDWLAPAAVAVGDVVWQVAWEALTPQTAAANADTATGVFSTAKDDSAAPVTTGAVGLVNRSTLTFAPADFDTTPMVAGDAYRLHIVRLTTAVEDTLVGDADLLRVSVVEKT